MSEERKVNEDRGIFVRWMHRIPYTRGVQIIALLLLVIPIQIFVIGDFYGGGFQTPLFRYQDTIFGSFVVLISHDLWSVQAGYANGFYALSMILWAVAAGILLLNVVLLCIGKKDFAGNMIRGGKLIVISALLFCASIILQYGPLFHSAIGISIPLGLPLLVLVGFWMYSEGAKTRRSEPEGP